MIAASARIFEKDSTASGHQHAQPRINHPAGNDDFQLVRRREQVGDGERVCEDLRGLRLEVTRRVIAGCAGVDDDRLVRLDEFGAGFTDGFLFAKLMCVAGRKSELVRFRIRQPRSAMRTPHGPFAFEYP
jgi:hypothetical protein